MKTKPIAANVRGIFSVRADADPIKLVQEIKASIEDFKAARKVADDAIKAAMDATGADVKKAIHAAEASAKEVKAVSDRLVEAEQKLVDNVMKAKAPEKSLGAIVVASDAYKQFAQGMSSRMRVEANTIIGETGSPGQPSDTLVPADRLPGIIPGAFRALRIRDLIPSGTTSSNSIEYTRESTFTNNAAETQEAATKPESALDFEMATAPVRTIAHWIKASKQVLEDAPMLQSYIDTRMRYGVELRIDTQLLNGNGSGSNISGITDSGNYTTFTPTTGETALDSLNRAKYIVEEADYSATGIVLDPATWGAIERLKGSDLRYVVGNPYGAIGPTLWGLPVVVTNAMTADKLLVAAFNISHQVFNRSGVVVEMFAQDDTNVQKNLLTIRAEARLALAIYRTASVLYGNLTI
jgi:HK97 family phage major capsid protein